MPKPLCELKKTLKREFKTYVLLVQGATHVCKKCGRVANDKNVLCKPVRFQDSGTASLRASAID